MFATKYGEVSGIEAQKLQRLCVNRVAIVQALKVEHVLPHLLAQNILSDADKTAILNTRTTQGKVRALIDILPRKSGTGDWYKHFRHALQHPDTKSKDVKKKYQIIIDFLENTILPHRALTSSSRPTTDDSLKLPKYDPLPVIQMSDDAGLRTQQSVKFEEGGKEETESSSTDRPEESQHQEEQKQRRNLLKSYYNTSIDTPEDFESQIKIPKDHFNILSESEDPEDRAQLVLEIKALEKIRNLEVVLTLYQQKALPDGFEVCMSSAAVDFLSESKLFHFYPKYFDMLRADHKLDIPVALCSSFYKLVDEMGEASDAESHGHVVRVGFGVFGLLCAGGVTSVAQEVMSRLVVYLAGAAHLEGWMATYEALVRLLLVHAANADFVESDALYAAAQHMADKIRLVSFGRDILDHSLCYVGLSTVMRERGSISSAYQWAQEALKEVDCENHEAVLDVLCNATLAYGHKLNDNKAEQLAVQAVRHAKQNFGCRSPQYIKALLHYCHFSNEYRQDAFGVQVARRALWLCERVYGRVVTVQRAQALQVLSRALLVARTYTDTEYHRHALDAWRTALSILGEQHPRLATYRYTLGQSLLVLAGSECDAAALAWAETEAVGALAVLRRAWGPASLRAAQGAALLGQVWARRGQTEDAERALTDNLALHGVAFSAASHYTHLARATLGAFYRTAGRPTDALGHLQTVVDTIDCQGVYLPWVHVCYDTVIELLQGMGRPRDAAHYQDSLSDWMSRHHKPSHTLSWPLLDAAPHHYTTFYSTINTWGTALKAARRGLRALRAHSQSHTDHTQTHTDHTDHTQTHTDHTETHTDHTDHTETHTDHTETHTDHTQPPTDHTQTLSKPTDHAQSFAEHPLS